MPTNSSEHRERTHLSDANDLTFMDVLGPLYGMPCLRLLSIYFLPHTVGDIELMTLYHALPRLSCLKLENPPLVCRSALRLFANRGSPPGDGTPFSMFTLKIDEDMVVRHPVPLIKCPIMLNVRLGEQFGVESLVIAKALIALFPNFYPIFFVEPGNSDRSRHYNERVSRLWTTVDVLR
jgi:hypothetical protein